MDFVGLCEVHLGHVVRVGADLELAALGVQGKGVKPHGTDEVNVGRLRVLNILLSTPLSIVFIIFVTHLRVHDLLVNRDPEARVLGEDLDHLER